MTRDWFTSNKGKVEAGFSTLIAAMSPRKLSSKRPAPSAPRQGDRDVRQRHEIPEGDLREAGPSGRQVPVEVQPLDSDHDLDEVEDDDFVPPPWYEDRLSDSSEDEVDLDCSQDSDQPIARRLEEEAKKNAPGTEHFFWRDEPALVRRHIFRGNYLLYYCNVLFCKIIYVVTVSSSLSYLFFIIAFIS